MAENTHGGLNGAAAQRRAAELYRQEAELRRERGQHTGAAQCELAAQQCDRWADDLERTQSPVVKVGLSEDELVQALTDPQNQPSQWGTIPLSMLPEPMELPHPDGPMTGPTDYEEWEENGYALGWNACLALVRRLYPEEGGPE